MRRKEAQETLKRQLETEAVARVQHVETEYERTLEVERKAAAAKLVQTATRMNKDYRLSTEQQLQEQERSTAERLKEYAEDARQALDVQTQKAGRPAAMSTSELTPLSAYLREGTVRKEGQP